MTEVRPWRYQLIDMTVLVLLCALAMMPLASTYGDTLFWLAAVGGIAIGAGIAAFAARLKWGPLEAAGLAAAGYFLFGGALALRENLIAGLIPSLDTLRDLALGVVYGWKQLLTVSPPVNGFSQLFGVPYLAGLVGALLAVSFGLRLRRHWFALLPVALLLIFAISFGDYQTILPALVGSGIAVVSLGWQSWRRALALRQNRTVEVAASDLERGRAFVRQVALGTAILVAAGGVGGAALTLIPNDLHRGLLREQVVPPLELQSFTSPLMSFRKLVKDGTDAKLFTVSGLPKGARIRMAALDLYDGIVYQVSGSGGEGSGSFARVGRSVQSTETGAQATLTFQIQGLRGVWLPDVGYVRSAEFEGSRAQLLKAGLNYNQATGTALTTGGVVEGDTYSLDVTIPAAPSADMLASAQIAKVKIPAPKMMPDRVQEVLGEAVGDATSPADQVGKIAAYLHDKGGLSHGLDPKEVQSRPGHSWARLSEMLDAQQLVGDDEQFAVLMALMLAQAGIPARVVMGFAPADSDPSGVTEVTGADVRAWVEVPFEGYGWVSYFPTPEQAPQQQQQQPKPKPRVQVPQPPLPPQEPAVLPPEPPAADQADAERPADLSWLWAIARIGGISLGALAILFGPALLMAWFKARRRLRRRSLGSTPSRVGGGWSELVDTANDVGAGVPEVATRREGAVQLSERFPAVGLGVLAARADAAVFGPGEPAEDEVAAYWSDVDTARKEIVRSSDWRARLLQFFWPVSLLSFRRGRVRR